jgi:glucan phosphoethanolaminetransferase (alkaline phosphatase superfamily)
MAKAAKRPPGNREVLDFDGRRPSRWGSGRLSRTFVIAAKLIASAGLVAATLGLLTRHTGPVHYTNIGQPFLFDFASGWYSEFYWIVRNTAAQSWAKALAYIVLYTLCVAAVFFVPFISNSILRCVLSAAFVVGMGYDVTLYDIGGEMPGYATTQTILSNAVFHLAGTAETYSSQIGVNLALGLLAFLVFCLPPPVRYASTGRLALMLVGLAILVVAAIVYKTGGYASGFPSPFASYVNVYRIAKGTKIEPPRDVAYSGTPSPSLRKIVLIIDESVRGDYLSLNNPAVGTTPFLVSRSGDIDNFGIASATANCSYHARMTMRFGVQLADIERYGNPEFPGPTIWQYARRAGLRTVYIDTFGAAIRLTNGMRNEELVFVDQRIVIDDMPQYERDVHVAKQLRQLLADPEPMFILVEKYGVHVPYNAQYPETANVFGATRTFDLGDRPNLVAQYRDAVKWSVDGFFARLLAEALPPATLMIYTSDHGQSLSENATRQTHCSVGGRAIRQEANIPLFAIASDPEWRAMLSRAAAEHRDHASAFDVFPTLLAAMGYDGAWIAGQFRDTLTGPLRRERKRSFWAMDSLRAFDGDE